MFARERSLAQFGSGRVSTLIATDVAARGLDVDDITHVINFDPPRTADDYTHRVGRTGRAGASPSTPAFVISAGPAPSAGGSARSMPAIPGRGGRSSASCPTP